MRGKFYGEPRVDGAGEEAEIFSEGAVYIDRLWAAGCAGVFGGYPLIRKERE